MSIQRDQVWPTVVVKWVQNKETSENHVLEKGLPMDAAVASRHIPVWKRTSDLLLIGFALPALLPVWAVLSLFIKLVSPGPVLFRQQRVGHRCSLFTLFKFRTMHVGSKADTHQSHLTDLIANDKPMKKLDDEDPRLIPLGKWIRAAGLDELPQLLNVLRGEMSLVGPRPCTDYELRQYEPWQKERFNAVPGLTGLWQVSGKNSTTFTQMVKLDIEYARKQSFRLDSWIILRTFPTLWRQVSGSKGLGAAVVGPVRAVTTTSILTSTTTTTNNTGGYEERVESGGRRMRVLGT